MDSHSQDSSDEKDRVSDQDLNQQTDLPAGIINVCSIESISDHDTQMNVECFEETADGILADTTETELPSSLGQNDLDSKINSATVENNVHSLDALSSSSDDANKTSVNQELVGSGTVTMPVVSSVDEMMIVDENCDGQGNMETKVSDDDSSITLTGNSEEHKEVELVSQITDSKCITTDDSNNEHLSKPETKIVKDDKDEKDLCNDEDLDDDILLVDDAEENKAFESSTKKYSFKTILQMPSKAVSGCLLGTKIDSLAKDENKKETQISILGKNVIEKNGTPSVVTETKESPNSDMVGNNYSHSSCENNSELKKIEEISDTHTDSGKKRSLSAEETGDSLSKRFKLGETDELAMEVEDSDDDDVVVTDDLPNTNNVDKETPDSEAADNIAKNEPIQLSFEALQSLIAIRVKAFMSSQKQTHLDKLNRRTRGMQSATNLWKETAKHLERSVLELTILNQKLEKRKAHSTAVKNLTSRTIGIQVNEEKMKSVMTAAAVNVTPIKRSEPVHSSAALSLPPSVLLNPPQPQSPQQTVRSQAPFGTLNCPPLRNPVPSGPVQIQPRPPQNRLVRTPLRMSGSPNIPSTPPHRPGLVPNGRIGPQQNVRAPVPQVPANNVVNLIDLTEEEDTRKTVSSTPSRSTSSQPTQTASKLMVGGKISSLPVNGYIQQTPVAGLVMGPKNPILQPSTPGAQPQLIAASNTVGVLGSQYQLVSINTTATPHTGAFIALVPGSRMAGPTNMLVTAGQTPNATSIPQSSPQTMAPATATAASKTPPHSLPPSFHISAKHPAPLPSNMDTGNAPATAKKRPPKPGLKISRVSQGIVLSWNMPSLGNVEIVSSYQLFAYQETESATPRSSLWKKVGDVKALPLPMACTLTQFQEGNKYHFAVRAVDQYGRCGAFSDASSIFLGPKI